MAAPPSGQQRLVSRRPYGARGRYLYRAVDQRGQVIDVYVSQRRDVAAARTFLAAAQTVHADPAEVVSDRAPAWAKVIEDLVPAALHNTGQYENKQG